MDLAKREYSESLILCIVNNKYHTTKLLLEAGADPNYGDYTAISMCILYNCIEILKLLIEFGVNVHSNEYYFLYSAAKHSNIEIMKILIEQGLDVNHYGEELLLVSVIPAYVSVNNSNNTFFVSINGTSYFSSMFGLNRIDSGYSMCRLLFQHIKNIDPNKLLMHDLRKTFLNTLLKTQDLNELFMEYGFDAKKYQEEFD